MYINSDFSRLEISLKGCLDNYRYFRSKLEDRTKLLVLVKANAYGHGAVEFATLMEDAGADYLAVAYPVEGIELRQAGIKSPIIVLTAGTDSFEQIVNYGLEPGIPNLFSLKELCSVLEKRGMRDFPVHIKLDSGMHRLGFVTEELKELEDFLKDCQYVKVKSIYSHLAAADDPSCDDFTLGQIELFKKNADSLSETLGYRPMYHILNSAGIERFPQYQFDMVRLGIGIYGVSALNDVKLSPAAAFKCKILQIKTLKDGDGTIGYGRHGKISPAGTVIATIPVGYADGVDRHLSCGNASFVLNGHRVPTIGNICMDMCMVDVTDIPDAQVGDEVVIIGPALPCEILAEQMNTISYEILCGINKRIPRIYLQNGRASEILQYIV